MSKHEKPAAAPADRSPDLGDLYERWLLDLPRPWRDPESRPRDHEEADAKTVSVRRL